MKTAIVDDEIYGSDIHVLWECSITDAKNYIISRSNNIILEDDGSNEAPSGTTIGPVYDTKGIPCVYVWLDDIEDKILIMHEAMHVAFGELRRAGIKIVVESEDAYTHLVEYIYSKIRSATDSSYTRYGESRK